jgi:hypothetical protein
MSVSMVTHVPSADDGLRFVAHVVESVTHVHRKSQSTHVGSDQATPPLRSSTDV